MLKSKLAVALLGALLVATVKANASQDDSTNLNSKEKDSSPKAFIKVAEASQIKQIEESTLTQRKVRFFKKKPTPTTKTKPVLMPEILQEPPEKNTKNDVPPNDIYLKEYLPLYKVERQDGRDIFVPLNEYIDLNSLMKGNTRDASRLIASTDANGQFIEKHIFQPRPHPPYISEPYPDKRPTLNINQNIKIGHNNPLPLPNTLAPLCNCKPRNRIQQNYESRPQVPQDFESSPRKPQNYESGTRAPSVKCLDSNCPVLINHGPVRIKPNQKSNLQKPSINYNFKGPVLIVKKAQLNIGNTLHNTTVHGDSEGNRATQNTLGHTNIIGDNNINEEVPHDYDVSDDEHSESDEPDKHKEEPIPVSDTTRKSRKSPSTTM